MIITYYENDLNEIKKDKEAILRLRFALTETINKGTFQPAELGEIARAIEIIENLLARNAEMRNNAEVNAIDKPFTACKTE